MRSRILIVDDDDKIISIAQGLAFEGYDVLTASNGAEGLKVILSEDPDVVVLDVMMPQVDGFEARRLREGGSTTPVLMLTAKDEVENRVKGLDTGADDYLVKPFALEERCEYGPARAKPGTIALTTD